MARVELPIVALNSTTGLPVSGASVAVKLRSSGLNATWWTAETGGTSSTAAITTDSSGRVTGWVDRGAYNCIISGTGITTYTEPFDASPAADNAIDALWLPDNIIANRHLADGVVTTNELGASVVTKAKLAADALNGYLKLNTQADRKAAFGIFASVPSWGATAAVSGTFAHGLGAVPAAVLLTPTAGDTNAQNISAMVVSTDATNVTYRLTSQGGALSAPGVQIHWMAIA